jgi:hypothetical protein
MSILRPSCTPLPATQQTIFAGAKILRQADGGIVDAGNLTKDCRIVNWRRKPALQCDTAVRPDNLQTISSG